MQTLSDVVEAEKEIVRIPAWGAPDPLDHHTWFTAPLLINDVVEAGLVLFGGCYINRPDVNVTFELRWRIPPTRRPGALARLDWRSLKGGHSVQRRRGLPNAGKRVQATHLHAFQDNFLPDKNAMRRGDLPSARDLIEQIDSYEALLTQVGLAFRITNMDVVPRPDWRYFLFDDSP